MKPFYIVGGLLVTLATVSIVTKINRKDSAVRQMQYVPNPGVLPVTQTQNKGLNPAHGLPGHRCDLAVGAPLPAAPVNSVVAQPGAAVTSAVKNSVSTAGQGSIAPGDLTINPAHGQPGHRCDIAVGAPLNSAASKPAVAPVQQKAIEDVSAVKINPAHGKSGHRCDIAVGAPLT